MLFLFQTLCLARDRVGVAVRKATASYLRALLPDRAERRMGCWRQTTARAFAEPRASDRGLSEGNSDLRILLVEDNQPLADWLARTLRKSSYTVDCVHDGAAADHLLHTESYALVILDLSLPKLDGNQVLKRLRARDNNVPVLILTVTNTPEGRITGLDTGADDYVTKPFDVAELEARIRALLRRDSQHRNPMLQCGSLSYDTNSRVFTLNDVVLRLTPHEQAVLEVLIKNMGKTVSKQFLADSIYGINEIVAPDAIEVYVHRLRKKLEPGDASIITLRGLGYLLKQRHGL
jgi:two-component system response regulator TctD